ncbi:hypothetical protein EVAR_40260_1 [Eumeta japonica]|uniref:Uncharacterized protein n=1 Tax=Eumeta variegata TaxID=151549 RepID=A0A4C1Y2N7_EUMVA|nr:hypothetical protein EVAR_40260_1 [Eumeta japonica]
MQNKAYQQTNNDAYRPIAQGAAALSRVRAKHTSPVRVARGGDGRPDTARRRLNSNKRARLRSHDGPPHPETESFRFYAFRLLKKSD